MKISKLKVKTLLNNYSIYIGSNLSVKLNVILKSEKINFNKILIIYDSKINKKELLKIKKNFKKKEIYTYRFITSEKAKNISTVNKIINILLKYKFARDDCVVSMGGGIVGDLSGFVASIFKRGIKFVNIPTTLLAQVDASIGGKTGVNHKIFGKNLIGSFYQPNIVITNIDFLKSLNKKELTCGYAEILKHSLIYSIKNFQFLEKNYKKILSLNNKVLKKTILESCKIKKRIVEEDEKEKDKRKILNLGHTFGHAYEAASGFRKNLNHGEGVMLGIKSAILYSLKEKKLSMNNFNRINQHILNLNFKLKLKNYFNKNDISKLIAFMKNDKKNKSSKINLILLNSIGYASIKNEYKPKKIKQFFENYLNDI